MSCSVQRLSVWFYVVMVCLSCLTADKLTASSTLSFSQPKQHQGVCASLLLHRPSLLLAKHTDEEKRKVTS